MPTDATLVFPAGFRLTDAAGDVVSGGKLNFYNAAGLVARTVYSNLGLSSSLGSTVYTGSDGMPVASSGSSTEVSVYTGTTPYKIIFTTSADVEIWTLDNLLGALDTSTFLTSSSTSTLSIPVTSKTANYTLVAGDRGKLVQGNPSGGNFTLTLTAAATLGDGWNAEIRNSGTSGQVMLAASEAISFEGQTFTIRALEIGEAMAIRCDGTAFKIANRTPPLMASRAPGVIVITDRVTADPVSPTPGARYIVTAAYGSYATHDIIEANGTTFNKYTPVADCGWIAYVQDENSYYSFQDSAWVELAASQAAMEAASSTTLFVTPGRVKFNPGVIKTYVKQHDSAGAPTIDISQNVTSLTDNSTGDITANLTTSYSSSNYISAGAAQRPSVGTAIYISISRAAAPTVSAFRFVALDDAANAIDSSYSCVMLLGDFA